MVAAYTNRLAREKSPYLLQHAHNPVDWHAWGEVAFAEARAHHRPIFLSIGYATCHWCHVMERESFENEAVAAFLRDHFVSIKVDREERPDVDKIYMTFVQSTVGGGGWPLNVFLTPDLKPFFGGTYFPPDHRQGRPGFLALLRQIAQLWRDRQSEITASADELLARLELVVAREPSAGASLAPEIVRQALDRFKSAFDPVHGGFGGAPKFPQPAIPAFMLRAAQRFGDAEAVAMVLHTCEKMAAGGIHDQLGGGFARYSVDAEWLVPHFEKMLYDNAQLAMLYLDAHALAAPAAPRDPARPDSPFASVARDILDYVLRDLTHPEGGFYSAEDADSEGQEGKFYCWTQAELAGLLSPEEYLVAVRFFGVSRQGNFVDHSHPEPLPDLNVLSVAQPAMPPGDHSLLAAARAKLLAARARRVRPLLDDKILASWNGLMLGAFARASAVLAEEKYRVAAERNLAFIREKLWVPANPSAGQPVGTLFHRWREGERDAVQLLTAYAFLLDGVIHLYEATLQPRHLDFAGELAAALLARFYDPAKGGFWQSPAGAGDLILRVKEEYDGAEPAGNSVAVLALLRLAALTGREELRQAAEATLQLSAARLQTQPEALACLLQALDFSLDPPRRAALAGDPANPRFRELLHAIHAVYQPNKIVLGSGHPASAPAPPPASQGEPTVVVCIGQACQLPTSDPARVRELLQSSSP
jgi:hypothetical protein